MAAFDFSKTVIEGGLSLGGLLKLHNDILAPLASALNLPSIIGDTLPYDACGIPDVSRIVDIKATPIEDKDIVTYLCTLCVTTLQPSGVKHFFKCLRKRGLLDESFKLVIVPVPTDIFESPAPASIFSPN